MTTQQQAYALFLSDELLKGMWAPNVLQNESALRARAAHELRRLHAQTQALIVENETLHAENETLRAGLDAARLEIASLRERVQMLGQLARDVNSRRVVELEAQLAAVGAGGVEPLRKRECLHQITEPDHFRGATKLIAAARQALEALDWLPTSKHSQALWHRQQPALAAIREALEAEPQPAAQAGEQNHLPLAITSAPERIWLDLGFNPYEDDVHFSHLHDLTWSQNNATGDGIEYVRADLAARGAVQAAPAPHYGNGRYLGFARYNDAYSVAQVQAMLTAAPSGTAREPLTTEEQMHKDLAALCKRIFNARIGKACSNCDGGTYQSDNNGYGQFHRCSKCCYVPMWGEDGSEFGAPIAARKGGQHAD